MCVRFCHQMLLYHMLPIHLYIYKSQFTYLLEPKFLKNTLTEFRRAHSVGVLVFPPLCCKLLQTILDHLSTDAASSIFFPYSDVCHKEHGVGRSCNGFESFGTNHQQVIDVHRQRLCARITFTNYLLQWFGGVLLSGYHSTNADSYT